MADFEDSSTLISGNLVTGHLNLLMITASPGCWIQVATTLVRVGAR